MNSPFGPVIPLDSQAAVYLLSTSLATFVPSRTSLYLIAMIYEYIRIFLLDEYNCNLARQDLPGTDYRQ